MENVLIILSYIGVIAFAVSGAMLAIRSEVDLFGVVFLSVITSFAGGLMRDIILNRYPYPALLEMRVEFIVCIVTSLVVFFVAFFCRDAYLRHEGLVDNINNVLDSIGISAFAVTGTQSAIQTMTINRAEVMPVVAVIMGMISCIGGGLLRDVILGKLPWVLKKRIYALAALAGGAAYVLLIRMNAPGTLAASIGCILVFGLRMCATFLRWDMPVAIRFAELDKPGRRLPFGLQRDYYSESEKEKVEK